MKIIEVDPRTHPGWQQLVESHAGSSIFNSPAWLNAVAATYHFDPYALLLIDDNGYPQAGAAFCIVDDIRGRRVISFPFSDYCDPLVDDPDQWQQIVDYAMHDENYLITRCLHNPVPLTDSRFSVVKRARWHCVSLESDLDTLWQSFEGTARRNIQKAQRNNVVVRQAENLNDLRTFFDMHLKVRKYRYQLLAQPYRFFENIWHYLIEQNRGTLLLAKHFNEIIGGALFLEWGDTLFYKFSASYAEHTAFRPTDLIIWEGIQYAKTKGLLNLDLGLSDWDQTGLVRFKRKFTNVEKAISFLQMSKSQQESSASFALPRLTHLFTDAKVPDEITEKAGDLLYHFFA